VDTEPLDILLAELKSGSTEIQETVIARLYENMASYRDVPRDQLAVSIAEIVDLVVDVVSIGVVPAPQDIHQARISASARSQQNVPVQDVMRAFRFTIGGIHEALLRLSGSQGFPSAEMVALTDILWRFSDAYTANQVAVFQSAEIDRVLSRVRRTQQFLSRLVEGHGGEPEQSRSAAEFGLRSDADYAAVRARSVDADTADRLRLGLERDARRRRYTALYAIIGNDLLGVTDTVPELEFANDDLASIGTFTNLAGVATSFQSAEIALSTAEALGTSGLVAASGLSWKMAAVQSSEVNQLLFDRYLRPIRSQGVFGGLIEDTVRAYLAEDRNIPRAARSIPVHVNTLRYRLRRFEELTGRDLDVTSTIVEVSWALEVTARLASMPQSHLVAADAGAL